MTVIFVKPIDDIKVVAKAVQAGTVVKVDEKLKTLTLDLPTVATAEKTPAEPTANRKSAAQ
jgi:hypothetical protein